MERTVPRIASEEIDLYVRTYYSLLRTSGEIKIQTLEEAHAGMNSLLHFNARSAKPDMSAYIYSILRLPPIINQVNRIILGQSQRLFTRFNIGELKDWEQVFAPARRRRCFYDRKQTLACFITSRSDIDDLIPILSAYQIESNKLHLLMAVLPSTYSFSETLNNQSKSQALADILNLDVEDLERLQSAWGTNFARNMKQIKENKTDLHLWLLDGSLTEYRRAIHDWWHTIESACPDITSRPVYFVSSNPHSLTNMLTGFAIQNEPELINYLQSNNNSELLNEWQAIQDDLKPTSQENFLYYLLKKYLHEPQGKTLDEKRKQHELTQGIIQVRNTSGFDIDSQIIDLEKIAPDNIDPRLNVPDISSLSNSNALILNIDYPLGMGAYHVLTELAQRVGELRGVYVLGKAATLNSVVGDVMLPSVVYDSQSSNTYLFRNCFNTTDVSDYLMHGTVLDNQKAVTVLGTFLQNHDFMDVFYREGYTDIEMEAGPYLSAIYEIVRPKRYPTNEIIDLHNLPFDVGFLHYASDKPLSKGKNLGAASLSYFGMDPTYASSIAVLKRIFNQEISRVKK